MNTSPTAATRCLGLPAAAVVLGLLTTTGCTTITRKYPIVPASRIDKHFLYEMKEGKTDVPFSALGQNKPAAHIVGPGDLLSVFVYGVYPPNVDEVPILQRSQAVNQRYYPPDGNIVSPSAGLPVEVDPDGTIQMPLIGNLPVEGLTIQQVVSALRDAYLQQGILEAGRERIVVSLMIPRVHRVIVMRQDTPSPMVALVPPGHIDQVHRGSGEVIDLPIYENDVLHALAATGGLPGTDAANEVWVIRRAALHEEAVGLPELEQWAAGRYLDACNPNFVRIPLRGCPGEPLGFSPEDVILDEGDVVYLPRRNEYFYTGGLLKGGKIPLPRDEDVDVLEAVALANGSVQGPLGQSGQVLSGGTPGFLINPSQLIVLRKLPDGEQMPIEVDLCEALRDPKERIYVQHGDMLILKFRHHEAVLNGVINFFSPNILIDPR